MPDDNAKFDKEALSLIESLKGRRKPAKRAPRKVTVAQGEKPPVKAKVVVRRAANRF
jgi:hypothetical protein